MSGRLSASLLIAIALAGCAGGQDSTIAQGSKVRSVIEMQLGVALIPVPAITQTSTFSNVRDAYVARTTREHILVVVFDSPAATRQILGEHGRLDGTEVLRRGNVAVLYTAQTARAGRSETLARALAGAFDRP